MKRDSRLIPFLSRGKIQIWHHLKVMQKLDKTLNSFYEIFLVKDGWAKHHQNNRQTRFNGKT